MRKSVTDPPNNGCVGPTLFTSGSAAHFCMSLEVNRLRCSLLTYFGPARRRVAVSTLSGWKSQVGANEVIEALQA